MQRLVLTLITCLSIQWAAFAQTRKSVSNINVSNTKAVFLGKTNRVDELTSKSTVKSKKNIKQGKNLPPNFFGRNKSKIVRPELEHLGPDPLRKGVNLNKRLETAITPIVNRNGLGNTRSPNDPSGAIGLNHYVQAVNATQVGVFSKTGDLISSFDAGETFWKNIGQESAGDPIILYDSENNQWIITEFAPSSTALLLVAVSEDADPLGVYSLYAFATPEFPDYPKYAIWENSVVVTTNEGGPGSLHQYFIEREALMTGQEDVTIQRVEILGNDNTEAGFYVTTPVNWLTGPRPKDSRPLAVKINDSSWGQVNEDVIEVFTFDIDFENTANTRVLEVEIPTTPFDGFPCSTTARDGFDCVPQRGGRGLDAIPEVVMNVPQYRNFGTHESIVLSFVTDITNGDNVSGIRWVELRKTEDDIDWTLFQEGTHAPTDDLDRYMSSIAMDADGNIGLAYNASSNTEFVSTRFTGRLASDPLGQMTFEESIAAEGTATIFSGGRYGDYAHMTVDPVDGQTFWHTTEYAGRGIGTRILSFKIASDHVNDLFAANIINPQTSASLTANETVEVQVINKGTSEANNFQLQLLLDTEVIDTYTHTATLASNDTLNHTFSSTVNLEAVDDYKLTLNILTDDDFNDNNTLIKSIKQLNQLDGNLTLIQRTPKACEENTTVDVGYRVLNRGFNNLTTGEFDLFLNDTLQKTTSWNGSVERGEAIVLEDSFINLPSGDNILRVVFKNPNGQVDAVPADNERQFTINNDTSLSPILVNIIPDSFPEEITWFITNSRNTDNVIASGGPFGGRPNNVLISEVACLAPDQCYTLTVEDSFNDGITNGTIAVVDRDGNVLASGNGNFSSSRILDFCVASTTDCNLMAEVAKIDASGDQLGTILIDASGEENLRYSIDGGDSFQESPVFNDLEPGTYDVVVEAREDCFVTETVTIGPEVVTSNSSIQDIKTTLFPNPTDDLIRLSVGGHTYLQGFLELDVMDISGAVLQHKRISRYDESFKGTISLFDYPSGIYFIKMTNTKDHQMIRVIKN